MPGAQPTAMRALARAGRARCAEAVGAGTGRDVQRSAGASRENGSSEGEIVAAGLGLEAAGAGGGGGAGCRIVAPGLVGCIGVASMAACDAASRGAPATITDGGLPGSMPR